MAAMEPERLRRTYEHAAWRYDWQHGLLTAFSDQRGRRQLVDRTVGPGDRVLDAGGGTGSTTLLAARLVGANGRVVVVDASAAMLDRARARAQALGLAGRIECHEGDIHAPDFPDASFDVVLSTYSLCPVVRPDRAALALYRLVRPGGRLGIAHSTEPRRTWLRPMAHGIESLISHWPALYLGCRSIDVAPALVAAGAENIYDDMIGVPLWPFRILIFAKPEGR